MLAIVPAIVLAIENRAVFDQNQRNLRHRGTISTRIARGDHGTTPFWTTSSLITLSDQSDQSDESDESDEQDARVSHAGIAVGMPFLNDMQELGADCAEAQRLRNRMVDEQLVARGLRDTRALAAFRRVPRHLFCPPGTALQRAYGDHPLAIGSRQTISQPLMVAEMTVALALKPSDRVLEIGTGSGYQAAILAMLADEVHTVERIPELASTAGALFVDLGLTNILPHAGDGTLGWPDAAPYDAIVVTAASPEIPPPLLDQLADGARLAIPVGSRSLQELLIVIREGQNTIRKKAGGCRFVPLLGRFGWDE